MTETMGTEKIDAKNITETDISNTIVEHVRALGRRTPPYGKTESIDELRAYFRLFLEPYLRDLKRNHVIKNFMIGISPMFFFQPKLRIIMPSKKYFEMPLAGFIL